MDLKEFTLADIAQELGLNPANARLLPVKVKVEPLADPSDAALALALASEDVEEAASPITPDGKPRMLKMTAWIAHGGPANRNRDAFIEEDLREVAANNLFAPPYLGMVDFNHDFFPYGAWYSARYEFDPIANEYGLLAEGALFAWRFPEMADKIIAEGTRNGFVPVSMACIAQWIESREGADGMREDVLRKPVFLAVSVLDVLPADPNARALGDEFEDSTADSRTRLLNEALLEIHATSDSVDFAKWAACAQSKIGKTTLQEDKMDETLIAQLTEALDGKADALIEQITEAFSQAEKVANLESVKEGLEAKVAELSTALETSKTELEAAQVALEAKTEELTTLTEAHEALQTEHDELKADIEAKRVAEVRTERLEMLPEIYVKTLEKREEDSRERTIARLVEMSEEEFKDELELISAGSGTSRTYADRSQDEGVFPSGTGNNGGGWAIDKYFN